MAMRTVTEMKNLHKTSIYYTGFESDSPSFRSDAATAICMKVLSLRQ